jgi:hypothetical protein
MIRQVDSSLLEEWEKMQHPERATASLASGQLPPAAAGQIPELRPPGAAEAAADVTRDTKLFTAAIRQRIFVFLRGLVNQDPDQALAQLSMADDPAGQPWTPTRLLDALESYLAEHQRICLDPEARNLRHTYVKPAPDGPSWRVEQVLVDPEGHNDWLAAFDVDLDASRRTNEPVLRLIRIGPVAGSQFLVASS